jgi:hypothetical protein
VPEKVKGHKKISEIPDVPKAIANLTIPLLTACRKREFPLPGFVYPSEARIREGVVSCSGGCGFAQQAQQKEIFIKLTYSY